MFKQKSPGNVVVLLIFGLLLKLPLFLFPKNIIATETDGPLYRWLINSLPANNGMLASLISFVLIYLQSIFITYLVNEYRMLPRQNYLPGMAYMLITSLLPEWSFLSAPLLCTSFVIWIFILLFNLYNSANSKPQVFNIGLLSGIASYIYFPSASFVVCILLGLMILKPFRWNELVLFFFGCLTPYYFHAVYLFLNDKLSVANFFPRLSLTVPVLKSSLPLAISTLLLTVPFLVGGFFLQKHLGKMLIQIRKNWSILLLYMLLAFSVPFFNSNQSFHSWVLLAAPFSAFHACGYFYQTKKFVAVLIFFLTVTYVLVTQYATAAWH